MGLNPTVHDIRNGKIGRVYVRTRISRTCVCDRRIQLTNRFKSGLKVLLPFRFCRFQNGLSRCYCFCFDCFENGKTVLDAVTLFRFTVFKTVFELTVDTVIVWIQRLNFSQRWESAEKISTETCLTEPTFPEYLNISCYNIANTLLVIARNCLINHPWYIYKVNIDTHTWI